MVDHVFVYMAASGTADMGIPKAGVHMVLEDFIRFIWIVLRTIMQFSLCGDRYCRWRYSEWTLCRFYLVGGRYSMGYCTLRRKFCADDGITSSGEAVDAEGEKNREFIKMVIVKNDI